MYSILSLYIKLGKYYMAICRQVNQANYWKVKAKQEAALMKQKQANKEKL